MHIETWPLTEMLAAPYNPRKDLKPGDPEYERLKKSIQTFDYIDPIIVNRATQRIVGGHQRYKILRDLGYADVIVARWERLTGQQAKKVMPDASGTTE